MVYFVSNLEKDEYVTPKTFWALLATTVITMIALAGTFFIYILFGLAPTVSMACNAVLLALWTPTFGVLWFHTKNTISDACSVTSWFDGTGVMVCHIYKALFAFAMFGVVSTLAALGLDVLVFKNTVSRGKYSQMRDHMGIAAPMTAPRYNDSRGSVNLDQPPQQYTTPSTQRPDQSGYEVPEEQFNYDNDTSYQGGHVPEMEAERTTT